LTLSGSIRSAIDVDESSVTVRFLPAESIVLGEANDYGRGKNYYDALLRFYKSISKKHPDLDFNYPVWGLFSEERIKHGDFTWPDRYYFYNPDGRDKRPAALYAIGYARGGYGQSRDAYNRIIDYIDANGFEICGDAYEEYPINELSTPLDQKYLIRVMVTVREKRAQ
jgi:effector-binding domain-containing protein